MYTQCPDCLTVFALDADVLAQARGMVSCGGCAARFDALASLAAQLPAEPFTWLPAAADDASVPTLELAVCRPSRPPPAPAAASDELSTLSFAPRFARPRRRRWPWVLASLLLLVLLGVQAAWIERAALIRNRVTGPWLQRSCATLGCRLPLVRDPSALRLLARKVEAQPGAPGTLLIGATIRNDAPFAQPWPVVVLTLSDASGKKIAMRRVLPREYLGDAQLLRAGMQAGASAALMIEAKDPGQQAVAFDFAFE